MKARVNMYMYIHGYIPWVQTEWVKSIPVCSFCVSVPYTMPMYLDIYAHMQVQLRKMTTSSHALHLHTHTTYKHFRTYVRVFQSMSCPHQNVASPKLTWKLIEGPILGIVAFSGPLLHFQVNVGECIIAVSSPYGHLLCRIPRSSLSGLIRADHPPEPPRYQKTWSLYTKRQCLASGFGGPGNSGSGSLQCGTRLQLSSLELSEGSIQGRLVLVRSMLHALQGRR